MHARSPSLPTISRDLGSVDIYSPAPLFFKQQRSTGGKGHHSSRSSRSRAERCGPAARWCVRGGGGREGRGTWPRPESIGRRGRGDERNGRGGEGAGGRSECIQKVLGILGMGIFVMGILVREGGDTGVTPTAGSLLYALQAGPPQPPSTSRLYSS